METENVIFYVSYGILTDERNSCVLCYGNGYGNGYVTVEISHESVKVETRCRCGYTAHARKTKYCERHVRVYGTRLTALLAIDRVTRRTMVSCFFYMHCICALPASCTHTHARARASVLLRPVESFSMAAVAAAA